MLQSAIPVLASLDAEETVKFYTEKLGFTFHNNWDGYLIFSLDLVYLHLWPTNDAAIPKATGCYINVTEVDQLYKLYEARGIVHPNGKLEIKQWGRKQFSILDNNGNIIHFGQAIDE
jgi:catechol 2,3-dioxygenase-like lactoylglutathione lyase family enzyme